MAKKAKRTAVKAVQGTLRRRAAGGAENLLGLMHGVIKHRAARPIFGQLSGDDLAVLSAHLSKGTLMAGLTPVADAATKADAVSAMPSDLGEVISKLSEDHVKALRTSLKRLRRDNSRKLVCGC
jgi:hypothetical protein